MGLWGTIAGIGGAIGAPFTGGLSLALPGLLGAAGAGAGGASQGMANNRGTQFQGQLDLMRMLLERDQQDFSNRMSAANNGLQNTLAVQQEGRTSGNDAWKRLVLAQRALNPIAAPAGLTPYQTAPQQPSADLRSGAEAMTREVMARLQGGNPVTAPEMPTWTSRAITKNDAGFRVDPNLLKPGMLEKILGITAGIAPLVAGGITGGWGGSPYSGGAPNGFGGAGGY